MPLARALSIARRVSDELRVDAAVAAVLVTGSVARGQAMSGADLDLVAVTDATVRGAAVRTQVIDGTRVDVEWLAHGEALAITAASGWTWELRRAARLGHAIAVHDPSGLAPVLAARSAAMQPDLERFEADLGNVYAALATLGQAVGTPRKRSEMARAVIDNLAHLVLLASPGRYQKPKWVMHDLAALGETTLLKALREIYGLGTRAVGEHEAVDTLVDAVLKSCGAPPRALLLGHAPDHPGAGLLARTHADARDMAAAGRNDEARFIARFAARMAVSLLGEAGDPHVRSMYDVIFVDVPPPSPAALVAMLDAADHCAGWLAGRAGTRAVA